MSGKLCYEKEILLLIIATHAVTLSCNLCGEYYIMSAHPVGHKC